MIQEFEDLKQLLLQAPEGQLDKSMLPLIEKWDSPPQPIQVLEVVDHCIYSALASGFTVSALQIILDMALQHAGQTLEQIEPLATWRNRAN